MQPTLRALTEQFDAVAASLDSACVELELLLANPAISAERRESGMIALADAQACLLRCGVRTTIAPLVLPEEINRPVNLAVNHIITP